jgi:ABC-type sugar transport system ATPase subunit
MNETIGSAAQHMLQLSGISKRFGSLTALSEVSFGLARSQIHALCGENGAGKSTLVKILMGALHADSGKIHIDGRESRIASPQDAQAVGLAHVAQELSVCPQLSILDNIWLGNRRVPLFHRRSYFRKEGQRILEMIGAGHYDLDRPIGTLTMAQRQVVEIARMLARNAKLFILDEPTASLSDVEIEHIFQALRRLKAENRTVLYITHRLGEVFSICDTTTVLRNGRHIVSGPIEDFDRQRLVEHIVGRPLGELYPARTLVAHQPEELEVVNLSVPGAVFNFSFTAHSGRITCIAGQVGSGAQDVVRALAGLIPDASGLVQTKLGRLRLGSVPRALAHGFTFISDDRGGEGIFLRMRVADNLVASGLAKHTTAGVLRTWELNGVASARAARVKVDPRRLQSKAFALSGGNQQKLLLGRVLHRSTPGVILMIEPTRGVDVGARVELYSLMGEFCALGYCLVIASSDLEEVVGIGDVVLTMYRGKMVRRYERPQIAMSPILADITHPPESRQAA